MDEEQLAMKVKKVEFKLFHMSKRIPMSAYFGLPIVKDQTEKNRIKMKYL